MHVLAKLDRNLKFQTLNIHCCWWTVAL